MENCRIKKCIWKRNDPLHANSSKKTTFWVSLCFMALISNNNKKKTILWPPERDVGNDQGRKRAQAKLDNYRYEIALTFEFLTSWCWSTTRTNKPTFLDLHLHEVLNDESRAQSPELELPRFASWRSKWSNFSKLDVACRVIFFICLRRSRQVMERNVVLVVVVLVAGVLVALVVLGAKLVSSHVKKKWLQ